MIGHFQNKDEIRRAIIHAEALLQDPYLKTNHSWCNELNKEIAKWNELLEEQVDTAEALFIGLHAAIYRVKLEDNNRITPYQVTVFYDEEGRKHMCAAILKNALPGHDDLLLTEELKDRLELTIVQCSV